MSLTEITKKYRDKPHKVQGTDAFHTGQKRWHAEEASVPNERKNMRIGEDYGGE